MSACFFSMSSLGPPPQGRQGGWSSVQSCRATIGCVVLAVALGAGPAWAAFPQIRLETVSSGELVTPVGLTNAGDGSNRLFTVDQRGKIQIIQNGSVLPTPFLDLGSDLVPARPNFDERGLLGLAFHPQYGVPNSPGEGKFYVFYSATSPNAPGTTTDPVNCRSTVAEYRVSPGNPNVADPASRRILLSFDKPQFNHNGGELAFGPDGYLYLGTGDGGGSNDNDPGHTGGGTAKPSGGLGNAQDRSRFMGKILRIDVNGNNSSNGQYGIPADNPFVGQPGSLPEIYAYGMRNPWRFSFDTGPGGTGRLFTADVGQGKYEEINIVTNGGNYGWRNREGLHAFDPTAPAPDVPPTDPIFEYAHPGQGGGTVPEIGVSISGGFVYRGNAFPELQGKYIFGDWSTAFAPGDGTLLGLEETPGGWQYTQLDVEGGNPIGLYITSFGRDEAGELYVVAKSVLGPGPDPLSGLPTGVIFKIVPIPEPATGMLLCVLMAGSLAHRRMRAGAEGGAP